MKNLMFAVFVFLFVLLVQVVKADEESCLCIASEAVKKY